jgi:hypothetical protein
LLVKPTTGNFIVVVELHPHVFDDKKEIVVKSFVTVTMKLSQAISRFSLFSECGRRLWPTAVSGRLSVV